MIVFEDPYYVSPPLETPRLLGPTTKPTGSLDKVPNSVNEQLHERALQKTEMFWDKFKHAKAVEEAKAQFPVGSWVAFKGSEISPNRPYAYKVLGYNEIWKDCRWNTSAETPDFMTLQTVMKPEEEPTRTNSAWSGNPKSMRTLTDDEKRYIRNFYNVEEQLAPKEEASTTAQYMNKQNILDRQTKRLKGAAPGAKVSIRGTSKSGKITRILDDVAAIRWEHGGSQPFFIEVELDNGVTEMFPMRKVRVCI